MDFSEIVGSDSDLFSDDDDDEDGLFSYDADDKYATTLLAKPLCYRMPAFC